MRVLHNVFNMQECPASEVPGLYGLANFGKFDRVLNICWEAIKDGF